MSETSTLSESFQITIPKSVRDTHQWDVGQVFAFIPKGTAVLLVPVPNLGDLKGLANGESGLDARDPSDRF